MLNTRLKHLALGGGALLAAGGVAWACADPGCETSWTLFSPSRQCADRLALGPGNDTRTNLLLLLRSKAGLGLDGAAYPALGYESYGFGRTFLDWHVLNDGLFPPREGEEEQGESGGSRCNSVKGGNTDFQAALDAAKGLPAGEKASLAKARERIVALCDGPPDTALPDWPAGVASAPGKAFLGYLKGADAFYAERWDEAAGAFAALSAAPDPWVREAALYMAARVELNAAQAKAFDEYGYYEGPAKTDKTATARARAALAAYLKAYPKGRYAASASGLVRRTFWLEGDSAALAREYDRLLARVDPASPAASALIQEIDNKLLFAGDRPPAAAGPLLTATLDLLRMRDNRYDGGDGKLEGKGPELTAAELAAQAPEFGGDSELHSFLQANHAFYVAQDMKAVLALVPDDSHRTSYSPLAFSRQVLRGQALAALGDRNEAGFWRDLLGGSKGLWQRGTAELGLALNMERRGQVAAVFAKGSPITDTTIRKVLLAHSADAATLKAAAADTARPEAERDLAVLALLTRQLTRGDYAGFLTSRPLLRPGANASAGLWDVINAEVVPAGLYATGRWSDGYPCQTIAATAQALARNPADPAARLCLGDFLRLNGFDDFTLLETAPPKGQLGSAASGFGGAAINRAGIYAAIIANRSAPANERAYALYRAIRCYAPSGYNSCGGTGVELPQRKAWFDQLKREYPQSSWARKLKFYW